MQNIEFGSRFRKHLARTGKRKRDLLLLLPAILFASWVQTASVAEFTEIDDCTLRLSGVITPGDSDTYRRMLEETPCSYRTLQLDSPGGSVSEAMKISELFDRTTTSIEPGDQCLSACSLIFMAGHTCAGSPYFCTPTREMHKTARLGFHALALDRSQDEVLAPLSRSFSEALAVLTAVQDHFSRIGAVVSSTGYRKELFPLDLFVRMFSTPPDSFYYIATNDQFHTFDIGLIETIPDGRYPRLDRDHAFHLCYNMLYEEYRGWNYSKFGFHDYGWRELAPGT